MLFQLLWMVLVPTISTKPGAASCRASHCVWGHDSHLFLQPLAEYLLSLGSVSPPQAWCYCSLWSCWEWGDVGAVSLATQKGDSTQICTYAVASDLACRSHCWLWLGLLKLWYNSTCVSVLHVGISFAWQRFGGQEHDTHQ